MPANRSSRAARARRGWLLGLVAVVGLAAAAPTIVATTPVRDAALGSILPPGVGTLTARGASLGWTGPTALTGVELRDAEGAPVFSADRVEIGSSLLELAAGGSAPLAVRVERPILHIALRGPQGSNLEAIAAAYERSRTKKPDGGGGPPKPKRPVSISVTDGRAQIADSVTGERWLATELTLRLDGVTADDPVENATVEASGKIAEFIEGGPAAAPAGDVALRIGNGDDGRRLARLRLGSAPLSLGAAFARRGDPTARMAGSVSAEGEAAWNASVDGAASAKDAVRTLLARGLATSGRGSIVGGVYAGRLTGGAPLRLEAVEAPWRLAAESDRLRVEQLELLSEIGSARLRGDVSPAEFNAWLAGKPTPPSGLRLGANIDLAKLGAVAPGVLRLRDDVRLESGRVRLDITGEQSGEGLSRLTGEVSTDSLAGVSAGRRVAWRDPLRAAFQLHQADVGWRVEGLRCESEFLTAEAAGDADRVQASVEFDLDRLAEQLGQFVDLGDWRLAGRGRADARWRRTAEPGGWTLDAEGTLDELFVGASARPLAREPRLAFDATLSGSLGDAAFARGGEATLTAGNDRLDLKLRRGDAAASRVQARLSGGLATWFRRLRLVAPDFPAPESLRLGGKIELDADGEIAADAGRLPNCRVALTDFAADLDSPRLAIREPRVEWRGDLAWDQTTGVVRSASGELVASAVSLRCRNVSYSRESPSESRGKIAFRGDAERIGSWFGGSARSGYAMSGGLSGTASLAGEASGVTALVNASGESLALLQAGPNGPTTVWSEPRLTAMMNASLASAGERQTLQLRELKLASQTLAATAAGRIADVGALSGVDLRGAVDYDLEKLSPLLWPKLGDNVRLVGRDRATFRFASDEAPAATNTRAETGGLNALSARVEAPWGGADVFGLPVGAGKLGATLAGGVLRTDPLDVAIGRGRLTTQAVAKLAPPAAVTIPPGPMVTDVEISAAVAERILKFIAPVLADATRIDGRFSTSLSDFAAPLDDPGAARASGVLNVHAAQLLPGPAIAEWAGLVKQIRGVVRDGVEGGGRFSEDAWLTISEKAIPFQMADRRVYHRGLEFNVGDAIVLSEGSVGVDETLDLLLSIPILDEWVARRPVLLGGLRGQAVRIPVRGTLSRPDLDEAAFRDLSRQLLQSAAQGAIDEGLNLLFDRLRQR